MDYLIILAYIGYYISALLGMFAHFLKKNIKGESRTEVRKYFKENYRTTLYALIATSLGFAIVVMADQANIVSAFGVGYMFDSAMHQWDSKGEKAGG